MRCWNVGPGDEVLVPSYNCGSDVSPVIATGARVLMYRVDRNAEIDIDDIRRRVSKRTKAICVTHYFGRPAKITELASFCREREIKLLEDCALSLFSSGVGEIGDAAIFNLRKSLPVSDGGVLSIGCSPSDQQVIIAREASPFSVGRGALSLLKRWIQRMFWIGSGALRSADVESPSADNVREADLPDIPNSYYYSYDGDTAAIRASRLARGLLNRINRDEIVNRRRGNYRVLRASMKDARGFAPLWREEELEPGVCPLGFPIVVQDKVRWCRNLNGSGVSVAPWWSGFHRGLDWGEFVEARKLKKQLVLLPVHQGLTADDMEYIARVAQTIR